MGAVNLAPRQTAFRLLESIDFPKTEESASKECFSYPTGLGEKKKKSSRLWLGIALNDKSLCCYILVSLSIKCCGGTA